MLNATFNNISAMSWQSFLLWDETEVTRLSPIRRGFAPGFVNYEKGCTRFAAASGKAY
jgi:hypothetical protein